MISIEIWEIKVINTRNDDQLNLIHAENPAYTSQCKTSTKCNGLKSFMLMLKNLLRTTNRENFSLIGQILVKMYFLKRKNNSF